MIFIKILENKYACLIELSNITDFAQKTDTCYKIVSKLQNLEKETYKEIKEICEKICSELALELKEKAQYKLVIINTNKYLNIYKHRFIYKDNEYFCAKLFYIETKENINKEQLLEIGCVLLTNPINGLFEKDKKDIQGNVNDFININDTIKNITIYPNIYNIIKTPIHYLLSI